MSVQTREQLLEEAAAVAEQVAALHISDEGDGWTAVAHELRALRLTLAAAIAPHDGGEKGSPAQWVRLELFGHTVVYGSLSETEVAGKRFLELTQPQVEHDGETIRAELTKRYHPNAVYAIEPRTEDDVLDTIRRQGGLFKWRDDSWHTEREAFAVDLDLDALEDRDREEDLF